MMNKKAESSIVGSIILVGIAVFFLFIVGILAGMTNYIMVETNSTIASVNFSIPSNSSIQSFQDIAQLIYYPVLRLTESLRWITYFMIFAVMISFGMLAFLLQRHPVYFVFYFMILILFTGIAIPISNTYEILLETPFILTMMSEFVIYSKIMLYFPQFIFFTGLIFAALGSIGIIKSRNTQNQYENLDY